MGEEHADQSGLSRFYDSSRTSQENREFAGVQEKPARFPYPLMVVDFIFRAHPRCSAVDALSIVPRGTFEPLENAIEGFRDIFPARAVPDEIYAEALAYAGEEWHSGWSETEFYEPDARLVTLFRKYEGIRSGLILAFTRRGVVTIGGIQPGYQIEKADMLSGLAYHVNRHLAPFVRKNDDS